jgi:hypothetical protein
MARDLRVRLGSPFVLGLDLPPPFRAITLREAGDAFAHAIGVAPNEGAGTLVAVGCYDRAEFAVVLEPEEALRTARRAIYAGLAALADALAAHAPPQRPIDIVWPDAIRVAGRLVGGARLAWPAHADEDAPPSWLVFAAAIRTAAPGGPQPGLHPQATALDAEGFDLDSGRLVESFARHFMAAVDAWRQDGFAEVASSYLSRLAPEQGVRREIDDNGDFLLHRVGNTGVERRPLVAALATPSWLDPKTGEPRW